MPCKACGACCRGISIMYPNNEQTLDWVLVRGLCITQKSQKFLWVDISNRCPNLMANNRCKLHGEFDLNKKTYVCRTFPLGEYTKEWKKFKKKGLDFGKILPQGCGFKWNEKRKSFE